MCDPVKVAKTNNDHFLMLFLGSFFSKKSLKSKKIHGDV
jgi:hypothetical protein